MDELHSLLDREHIRACIARVARGEDRRDAALISASFWPDARTDFGIFSGNFAEYLAWVVPGASAVIVTQHVLGQSHIELQGDIARVETHVLAYHRVNTGAAERDLTLGGRYLDRLEKRAAAWRIAERTMLYDWSQDFGQSVDWSTGMMGMPFSAPHYAGKATGDFSATFFGSNTDASRR